jgi:hypothetical protein
MPEDADKYSGRLGHLVFFSANYITKAIKIAVAPG